MEWFQLTKSKWRKKDGKVARKDSASSVVKHNGRMNFAKFLFLLVLLLRSDGVALPVEEFRGDSCDLGFPFALSRRIDFGKRGERQFLAHPPAPVSVSPLIMMGYAI